MQREITDPGPLLDDNGLLRLPGWARQPLFDANLERALPGVLRRLRIKRWDYYGVWTPELFASATLSDLGYAGLAFVYAVDLQAGRHVEHTRLRPLGRGCALPRNSDTGDVHYGDPRVSLAFELVPGMRRLRVSAPDFDGGQGLSMEVDLIARPDHESIVMATPLGDRCFYYNRKTNGMPASGAIRWGERSVPLAPDRCLGQLDWGRGVWPYRTHWIWASANGFLGNDCILGLNLGAGFGDLRWATENAMFVDGRLHKFGAVRFAFDSRDCRKSWRMTSDDGRLDVEFQPSTERIARFNICIIRSEVHQVFGRYNGRAITDTGETIKIRDLPGFAEEHFARW